MADILPFSAVTPATAAAATEHVGGKGLGLGLLTAAGLPVPAGFCVTTAAFRRLRGQHPGHDPALRDAISAAYRQLGGGPVAVRSSATAEDGAANSFAGQGKPSWESTATRPYSRPSSSVGRR